jgi:hypothetical protein
LVILEVIQTSGDICQLSHAVVASTVTVGGIAWNAPWDGIRSINGDGVGVFENDICAGTVLFIVEILAV